MELGLDVDVWCRRDRCVGPDISGTPVKQHIQTSQGSDRAQSCDYSWSVEGRLWSLETTAGEAAR